MFSKEEKFQDQYRIESTRLKNWDYSSSGYYFVTICIQDHRCYFGNIVNQKMQLSEIGEIVEKYWLEIPNHFPNVDLDFFVVMPNHIHGVIIIEPFSHKCRDEALPRLYNGEYPQMSIISPSPRSLSTIIGSYKSICSKIVNQKYPKINFAWQPRFHDHIIRNEKSYQEIRRYIFENPAKWQEDELFIC